MALKKAKASTSVVGITLSSNKSQTASGLRPVNLRTDLAPLADLIELAFDDTMDENGRAAIREWRYLSNMGLLLSLLSRLDDLALGIGQGYVWIEDGKLVGNASIYPAGWPGSLGKAWLVANVGVHPDYQRRGIARQLMLACIEMIRARGGKHAILQVDYDNTPAINLYDSLGFIRERAFTTWWRSAITATPPVLARDDLFIAHPRRRDWQQEYELAQSQRSNTMGGIGWLKPLHGGLFRASIWQRIVRMFSFNSMERLVIRADNNQNIVASLWIENGFAQGRTRLTLMAYPDYHDPYAEALLNTALRRFRTTSLVIDHPHDDTRTTQLLETYRFRPHRTLWHMRLSFS